MSVKIKVDDGKIVIDINNFYQFYAVKASRFSSAGNRAKKLNAER